MKKRNQEKKTNIKQRERKFRKQSLEEEEEKKIRKTHSKISTEKNTDESQFGGGEKKMVDKYIKLVV